MRSWVLSGRERYRTDHWLPFKLVKRSVSKLGSRTLGVVKTLHLGTVYITTVGYCALSTTKSSFCILRQPRGTGCVGTKIQKRSIMVKKWFHGISVILRLPAFRESAPTCLLQHLRPVISIPKYRGVPGGAFQYRRIQRRVIVSQRPLEVFVPVHILDTCSHCVSTVSIQGDNSFLSIVKISDVPVTEWRVESEPQTLLRLVPTMSHPSILQKTFHQLYGDKPPPGKN